MYYATIKATDVANGPGIRTSLFVSGCRHACKGCFNEDIWNFKSGEVFTDDTLATLLAHLGKPYVKGLTLLGGEPLDPKNQEWVYRIIQAARKQYPQKTIWCYTGYTYEFIKQYMYPQLPYTQAILNLVDVLIDGRFVESQKDLKLQFRGSSNQRVIDLRATEQAGQIIWALGQEEIDKYQPYHESVIHLHKHLQIPKKKPPYPIESKRSSKSHDINY